MKLIVRSPCTFVRAEIVHPCVDGTSYPLIGCVDSTIPRETEIRSTVTLSPGHS